MSLETDRLILRPITRSDNGYILAQLNDPRWLKYIGDRNIHTLKEAETYIQNKILAEVEKGVGTFFVITRKDDRSTIMGQCGIFKRAGLEMEDLGFAFLEPYCGKGYGYEASRTVLDYALNTMNLKSLCAITSEDNVVSQKLLLKLGMRYVDTITLPNIEGVSRYYEI